MASKLYEQSQIGDYPRNDFSRLLLEDGDRYPFHLFYAGTAVWCRSLTCRRHRTGRFGIEFVKEGVFRYETERGVSRIAAGELVFLHGNTESVMTCESETGVKYVFGMMGPVLPALLEYLDLESPTHYPDAKEDRWTELLRQARDLCDPPSAEHRRASVTFVMTLLMELAGMLERSGRPSRLNAALEYLTTHIHEKFCLKKLAGFCSLSPAGVIRLFEKHLRTTPGEYARGKRLAAASELLRSRELSVKEVAAVMNYPSPQYFASEFKKKYGCSPRDFSKGFFP